MRLFFSPFLFYRKRLPCPGGDISLISFSIMVRSEILQNILLASLSMTISKLLCLLKMGKLSMRQEESDYLEEDSLEIIHSS